ncbi:hypothetical protein U6A24_10905 [Aquimarina gracilis]|uniref:Uncharacterized protein n=1 Tax=Aquimarina gracilis TaxID=874422 RepID=A0ABU5ZVT2_9FLAO|nr:hypothetical protein [Aquimarina gracilis]MEB3345973.1 hypothetical protein [Aquimarina gracilis]
MSYKNGISSDSKKSKELRKEINYWKLKTNQRKCKEFSQMSYWEMITTNTAL